MQKAKQIMGIVVSLVVGLIILAYLFPVGMDALVSADTSNWSSATQSIWGVLPIFAVIVPLGVFIAWVMDVF